MLGAFATFAAPRARLFYEKNLSSGGWGWSLRADGHSHSGGKEAGPDEQIDRML
jgi:hypothetical protein